MTVTPPGWVFLVITCIVLPFIAIWTATRPRAVAAAPSRAPYFISVFVTQASMLFLALSAASYNEVALFPSPQFGVMNALGALAFLAIALGTIPARWSWKPFEEKRRVVDILPQQSGDLWWWAIVALAAGIIEEIVYRGVMFNLWQRVLGPAPAVAVCIVVFALAHYVQGWRAMLAIGAMALGFHWVVIASGQLYPAMLVHILYDLFAGMIMLRLARRDQVIPTRP